MNNIKLNIRKLCSFIRYGISYITIKCEIDRENYYLNISLRLYEIKIEYNSKYRNKSSRYNDIIK